MQSETSGPQTEVLTVHDCWRTSGQLRWAGWPSSPAADRNLPRKLRPGQRNGDFRTGTGTKLDALLGGGSIGWKPTA